MADQRDVFGMGFEILRQVYFSNLKKNLKNLWKDSSDDEQKASDLPPLLASLARGEANAAKMVLAYEVSLFSKGIKVKFRQISVNEDFQMVSSRERDDTVQGQVAKTMERAFWDILRFLFDFYWVFSFSMC